MTQCHILIHNVHVQVTVFKVNTEDVFKRAKKMVEDLTEEVQTLNIQKEEVTNIVKRESLPFCSIS